MLSAESRIIKGVTIKYSVHTLVRNSGENFVAVVLKNFQSVILKTVFFIIKNGKLLYKFARTFAEMIHL